MSEWSGVPGAEKISVGLTDAAAGRWTEEALLIAIAVPRLRSLGIEIPASTSWPRDAELELYRLLIKERRLAPYNYYNSLIRLLVSFCHVLERRRGAAMRDSSNDR